MYMDPVCRAPREYARRVAATRGRESCSRGAVRYVVMPRRTSRSRSPIRCRERSLFLRRRRSASGKDSRRRRRRSASGRASARRARKGSSPGNSCDGKSSAGSRRDRRGALEHRRERRSSADSRSGSQWTRPRGRTVSPSRKSSSSPRHPRQGLIAAVLAVRNPVPLEKLPLMLEPGAARDTQHALAFDGEMYNKDAFLEYYGSQYGNDIWKSCAERTNSAISFVQAWLYFIRATGKDDTMHALLRYLRLQEWANDFRWKSVLLIFVFRALSLRGTFFDQYPHIPLDADLDNERDRKALSDIALSWTWRYLTTSAASRGTARSVLRVFWNDWFGHKDFALLIATKHVLDWQMTLTLLSKRLQDLHLL